MNAGAAYEPPLYTSLLELLNPLPVNQSRQEISTRSAILAPHRREAIGNTATIGHDHVRNTLTTVLI